MLQPADTRKALSDRSRWRAEERCWGREGCLPRCIWTDTPARTPGIPQFTEVATTTEQHDEPTSLLPTVPTISEEERNKVIEAYLQGVRRRETCSYLRWGNAKYPTIVKPVLDVYEEQEHPIGNVEEQAWCF